MGTAFLVITGAIAAVVVTVWYVVSVDRLVRKAINRGR